MYEVFLWAMQFGKRVLKTLLGSYILTCCLKITADLCKINLKYLMRE